MVHEGTSSSFASNVIIFNGYKLLTTKTSYCEINPLILYPFIIPSSNFYEIVNSKKKKK